MSRPTVSCIVPAYNAEEHLGEALESILAQTHPPFEVIVSDDGSTDGTAAVAEAYAPAVTLLRLPENRGQATARNFGVSTARGDLVAFLDADDLWHPEKLAAQVAHLEANPGLEASFCEIENFWEEGQEDEEERWRRHGRVRGTYLTQTLLATRELLLRLPLDTSLLHADHVEWVLRAREAGVRMEVLPRVLVHRRRHGSNITTTDPGEVFDAFFDVIKSSLDRRRGRE